MTKSEMGVSIPGSNFYTVRRVLPHGGGLHEPTLTGLSVLLLIYSAIRPLPGFAVVSGVATTTMCGGVRPMVIIAGGSLRGKSGVTSVCERTNFRIFLYSRSSSSRARRLGDCLSNGISTFVNGDNINGSALLGGLFPSLSLRAKRADGGLNEKERAAEIIRLFRLSNYFITSAPKFSAISLRHCRVVSGDQLRCYFPRFRGCLKRYVFASYSRAYRGNYEVLRTLSSNRVRRAHRHDCIRVCGRIGSVGS